MLSLFSSRINWIVFIDLTVILSWWPIKTVFSWNDSTIKFSLNYWNIAEWGVVPCRWNHMSSRWIVLMLIPKIIILKSYLRPISSILILHKMNKKHFKSFKYSVGNIFQCYNSVLRNYAGVCFLSVNTTLFLIHIETITNNIHYPL